MKISFYLGARFIKIATFSLGDNMYITHTDRGWHFGFFSDGGKYIQFDGDVAIALIKAYMNK